MIAVARAISEMVLLVLALASAPADQQEVRVHVVGASGYVETMIAKREAGGWGIFDGMNGELERYATVETTDDPLTFVLVPQGEERQRIALGEALPKLELKTLRSARYLELEATDGSRVEVRRNGNLTFISAERMKQSIVME